MGQSGRGASQGGKSTEKEKYQTKKDRYTRKKGFFGGDGGISGEIVVFKLGQEKAGQRFFKRKKVKTEETGSKARKQ